MRSSHFTIIFLILLTLFCGCSKKKKITGNEYVPQEVLVDVLLDIHLIDGITSDRKYYRKYNFNDSIEMMNPIFEKYNITKAQFDSTMIEYSRYPELLDKVYDEVIMKLNLMLDEIDEENIDQEGIEIEEKLPEDNLKNPANKVQ